MLVQDSPANGGKVSSLKFCTFVRLPKSLFFGAINFNDLVLILDVLLEFTVLFLDLSPLLKLKQVILGTYLIC